VTSSADAINDRAYSHRAAEERSYWEGVQLANEAVLKTLIEQFARLAAYDSEKDRIELLNLLQRSVKEKLLITTSEYDLSRRVEYKVAEATINSVFASLNGKPDLD